MEDLLTPAEAAEALVVKVTTLEQWRAKKIGPAYIKLGTGTRSPVRYRKADIDEFLKDNTVQVAKE